MATTHKQYCKLIMVTPDNNNKYYEMYWDGGSTFNVNYGRVESTKQTACYPYSKWRSKYNEKINKGYKDVTDLIVTEVKEEKKQQKEKLGKIDDAMVDAFLTAMKSYTDNLVSKTYSVKYENVTEKMLDRAQDLLDELAVIDRKNVTLVNTKLVELYTVIPRYMSDVRKCLLPNIDMDKTLVQEQDNLDAMRSQVKMYKKPSREKKDSKKVNSLLDMMGISMKETKANKDLDYLIKQLTGKKIKSIFEVKKEKEDKIFEAWMTRQKDKRTSILIHGTRCTSVIPILEQGLKIRPAGNYQFSGKAYGEGNYFSEVCNKSLNYTGYDSDKVLLVYEVHTGNPFVYNGWYRGNSFALNYRELSKRGFDSTYVNAGNGLLNSEIIAYNEHQSRIKYIIWLKQ